MELVSWGCRLQAFILQVVLVGSEAERRGGGGGGGGSDSVLSQITSMMFYLTVQRLRYERAHCARPEERTIVVH